MDTEKNKGSLVLVGSGIQLGRDMTERTLSEIKLADQVYCLTDSVALAWLKTIRGDVQSLHECYGDSKDRRQTYREMESIILQSVRAGKRVCAVFYGHPGVFADVPHGAINQARKEGYSAKMLPGVSAEDCVIADLGMDPGKYGMQSMEATQFLVYERQIDAAGMLLLWQVALSGDLSCKQFDTTQQRLQILVDKLSRWYPLEHEVILYEAATMSLHESRIERMELSALVDARMTQITTLVLPPVGDLQPDEKTLAALGHTEDDLKSA